MNRKRITIKALRFCVAVLVMGALTTFYGVKDAKAEVININTNAEYRYMLERAQEMDNEEGLELLDKLLLVPSKVKTVNNKSSKDTSITLKWNVNNKASGCLIERYNPSTVSYDKVTQIDNNTTNTYTDSGLVKGTSYRYRIRYYRKLNNKDVIYGPYKLKIFKAGISVSSISYSYLESSTIKLATSQKRRLLTVVKPANAYNKEITYSSSDVSVARVDAYGNITAVAVGNAVITATAKDGSGVYASVKLTVTKRTSLYDYSFASMKLVDTTKQKYSYNQMRADITKLINNYGDRIRYNRLSSTADNRNLYEVILGNPNASKHMFVGAAMHAREYMTSQLVMKQLEYYCKYYYTGSYKGKYFSEIFDKVAIHIVPMINPDGVSISQFGSSGINNATLRKNVIAMCKKYGNGSSDYYTRWKANGRGVDLNKNFSINWSLCTDGPKEPCNQLYKGSKAESENETKILISLVNKIKPCASISYHAMGEILYWDYGQTGSRRTYDYNFSGIITGLTGYSRVKGFNKLKANGFSDWVSIKKKVPAVTVEIGQNIAPVSIDQFSRVWSQNRNVVAATANYFIK